MPQDRSPIDGDDTLLLRLQALLTEGWSFNQKKTGIKKRYRFSNWTRCHAFAQLVGIESWREDHHALLIISCHDATVFWMTYRPELNVSKSDIKMAEVTDSFAAKFEPLEALDQLNPGQHADGANETISPPDGWRLEGTGLFRTFHFETYTKCRDFVDVVAVRCKSRGCWPTMTYFPCWVQIYWPGLSAKEIEMAQFCATLATQIGIENNPDIGEDDRILGYVS